MSLSLHAVSLTLAGAPLITAFDLVVEDGEVVTIMGPSGCGKSSLLAYIAGDLTPPLLGHGRIFLNERDVTDMRPEQRKIGRLFQDDLLFPHLTVGQNILFGMARGSKDQRVEKMRLSLQQAELGGWEDRMPSTLSGGQKARVSLMRALVAEPSCMLLDEPFNKLDEELRTSMRAYVYSHLQSHGIPSLVVSHDKADAPRGGRVLHIRKSGEIVHA